MIRKRVRFLTGLAAAVLSAGCQDELASPTKGFIEVDTGGVSNVQVFLDGVPRGVDVGTIGPIDAGTYHVVATNTTVNALGTGTQVNATTSTKVKLVVKP